MKIDLWNDYECKELPEILSFIVDNRGKTVPTDDNGTHVLIATNCIKNECLYPVYEKLRYISDEVYGTWFRAHPLPGDIIFVNKGTPGKVCMVPDPVDFSIAQDMMAFRVNPELIYNKYLFAILRSTTIQNFISSSTVGDVIPHFKKQQLKDIKVPVPPMEIQRLIGDMYFEFCEKEDVDRRIIDNLWDQIDAEFLKLYFSEEIKTVLLGDVVKRRSEKAKKEVLKVLSPVSTGEIMLSEEYFIKQVYSKDTSKYLRVEPFDFCYNPARANIGSIGMSSFDFTGCVSPVYVVFYTEPKLTYYLSRFIKTNKFKEEVVVRSSGSVRQALKYEDLCQIDVNIPDDEALRNFNSVYDRYRKMIDAKLKEIEVVSTMKRLMFERIISGEQDVIMA